ncbi:MAG: hypothetical protein PHQ44_01310 [Anaerovibrio sp.]|nr:hypothetical protein [Anaerovibrio sp.]
MAIIFIGTILICLLLLLVLYRNLPNKKVFYAFCFTLLAAIGGIVYSLLFQQPAQEPLNESAIRKITAQQQIFDGWYTDYKKELDLLDYNWAQCQKIVSDYHNDNISIHTVYTRLNILTHQAQAVSDELNKLPPPISLDDTNYDLTTLLLNKTQDYANAQLTAIQALRNAADPANINTDSHEQQSRILRETMVRNGPDGLFTADETNALRQRLTIPEK